MKIILLSFLVVLLASSCSKGGSANLSGSDSLVINFNTKGTNTIEKTVTTTEKNAIKKLARFIDGKTAPEYKCGYDGNMIFYKDGKEAGDVSFNFSGEGCRHFIQLVDAKLQSTKMSDEAVDFLKSLSEGKNWY